MISRREFLATSALAIPALASAAPLRLKRIAVINTV